MANSFVQVPPDSTGKFIDAASLDVGATAVQRQRIVIGDNSATAQFATVTGGALLITGTVSLGASVANIGAVSLGAGTANIGFLNNISATVVIAGVVSLGAGTANIGFLNNISATVIVAGVISFGPGTAAVGNFFVNAQPTKYSASWGPKTVVISTSANVTLVASPGVGNHIYVTMLAVTNGSGTLSRADIYQSLETGSTIAKMSLAASGGGFVIHYDPPVKLESATALTGRVKPNASDCYFNIHFFTGT